MSANQCNRCGRDLQDPGAAYGWRCEKLLGVSPQVRTVRETIPALYEAGVRAADAFLSRYKIGKTQVNLPKFYEATAKYMLVKSVISHDRQIDGGEILRAALQEANEAVNDLPFDGISQMTLPNAVRPVLAEIRNEDVYELGGNRHVPIGTIVQATDGGAYLYRETVGGAYEWMKITSKMNATLLGGTKIQVFYDKHQQTTSLITGARVPEGTVVHTQDGDYIMVNGEGVKKEDLREKPAAVKWDGNAVSSYARESDVSVIARMLYGEDPRSADEHIWVLQNRLDSGERYGGKTYRELVLAENQFTAMKEKKSRDPASKIGLPSERDHWEHCFDRAYAFVYGGIEEIPYPVSFDRPYTYTRPDNKDNRIKYPKGAPAGGTWFFIP